MAACRIVFANRGLEFDGDTPRQRPLGGVESATAALAEALARRGHEVSVHNDRTETVRLRGVTWAPLRSGLPRRADLFVANRDHELLLKVPFARRRVLWLHNPASKADSLAFRLKMALLPPTVVVLGAYHRATVPAWMARYRVVEIPLAVSDDFRAGEVADAPPGPRAVFTSNPARNLDRLLRLWTERIQPRVPGGQLELYSGPEVYQLTRGSGFAAMNGVLATAEALADKGVVRRQPLPRPDLARQLRGARVMLYPGHWEETFCLSLAEAQALGIPCVVQPIGSAPERVRDRVTGFVAADDDAYVECAVRLLTDDVLWREMHTAALALQRDRGWDDVAADFETLIE
jgi:glycosyltransferase involved in cell wall biosynthesis